MRSVYGGVPVALALFVAAFFIAACPAYNGDEDAYLFRIGEESVSVATFRHALELEQPNALSEQGGGDVEAVLTFLNQMIEERLLLARAAELGIAIDEETLEAAIDEVRADYPDDTFEETLLENAVSFNQWREQLRRRLLLEKVVNQELEEKVEISPEDVAATMRNITPTGRKRPVGRQRVRKRTARRLWRRGQSMPPSSTTCAAQRPRSNTRSGSRTSRPATV
jgi:hypothetical protein